MADLFAYRERQEVRHLLMLLFRTLSLDADTNRCNNLISTHTGFILQIFIVMGFLLPFRQKKKL